MPEPVEPVQPAAQPLLGFLTNDAWETLVVRLGSRIDAMQALPDGPAKQGVFGLLDDIDAVHREALHRLVRLFKEGVLEKVVTDPAIHTLMELYDLLPQPALAAPPKPAFPTIPIRAVRVAAPAPPMRHAHWVPALAHAHEMAPGTVRADLCVDGTAMLLARRGDEWFALDAACPTDGSPLQGAGLSGYTLSCPNHAGCHYDVRSGARVGGGPALRGYNVKTDDNDRVLVGLDMDYRPGLPAF